jgi:DNA polymerase-1
LAAAAGGALVDDTMIAAHVLNPSRTYANLEDAAGELLELRLPPDASAWADAVLRIVPVARERLAQREQSSLYAMSRFRSRASLRDRARGLRGRSGATRDRSRSTSMPRSCGCKKRSTRCRREFNIGSPQQLGRGALRKAAAAERRPHENRLGDGRRSAAAARARARDRREGARISRGHETQEHLHRRDPKLVGADGRLRTVFNQTATATGRLSSTNPNLQNVPVRTELGRRIRRAFVAPAPERVLLAADYSQIELRIMAHLSGDEAMREAFARGDDIHDVTARGIFARRGRTR